MAVFARKVGRLVAVRGLAAAPAHPNSTQLRPARITAVGGGTLVDCKVLHATGETYAGLARWSRSTPTTLGWVRT
jgi:hypothetical protein